MDYYNYVNQSSVEGRHSSSVDFATSDSGVDVASLRFSLSGGGGGRVGGGDEARCSTGTGAMALRCLGSPFVVGQPHHLGAGAIRLDSAAVANGKISPGESRDCIPHLFTSAADSQNSAGGGNTVAVDTLAYRREPGVTMQYNHHREATTSMPHEPQRLRYMPPPSGSKLDHDDDDDYDDAAMPEDIDDDGHSSSDGTRSPTLDCRNPSIERTTKTDGEMTTAPASKSTDKASENTAAAVAAGLTSTPPFIYPWMRRVHSSNNSMLIRHLVMIKYGFISV